MSKLLVIADKEGNIIATSPVTEAKGESSALHFAIVPQHGQTAHEVNVPNELLTESAAVLHENYKLRIVGADAKLENTIQTNGSNITYYEDIVKESFVRTRTYIPVPWSRHSIGSDVSVPWSQASSQPEGAPSEARKSVTHTVRILFKGVFQLRLATDPDASDERRGVNGWTFAHTGEPDLDRVIRFNNPAAPRSCANKVTVVVIGVQYDGAAVNDALIGKKVDLGPRSYFAGENASAGTEPIEKFEFHIRVGEGPEGYIFGQAIQPPKGTGVQSMDRTTFEMMGLSGPEYWQRRIDCLKKLSPTPGSDDATAINERLDKIQEFAISTGIRNDALRFYVDYVGNIDKNLTLNIHDSEIVRRLKNAVSTLGFDARFYNFDADGLVGKVRGSVTAT